MTLAIDIIEYETGTHIETYINGFCYVNYEERYINISDTGTEYHSIHFKKIEIDYTHRHVKVYK